MVIREAELTHDGFQQYYEADVAVTELTGKDLLEHIASVGLFLRFDATPEDAERLRTIQENLGSHLARVTVEMSPHPSGGDALVASFRLRAPE